MTNIYYSGIYHNYDFVLGLQWSNMWKTVTPDDSLTLGYIMLMLILDTFLYLLIALYVEAIFPGEYGVPKEWYFPFTSSFWCGQPRSTGRLKYYVLKHCIKAKKYFRN